jgi:hypothetical protein
MKLLATHALVMGSLNNDNSFGSLIGLTVLQIDYCIRELHLQLAPDDLVTEHLIPAIQVWLFILN